MNDFLAYKERRDTFGKLLAQERKNAGLTQDGLADRIEAETGSRQGQNTISNWEQGKSFPGNIETVFALSKILGCDCGYLLGDYDERTHDLSGICMTTGLSEETVSTLCNLRAWRAETDLAAVIDALVYDLNHATKGDNIPPLVYLISWFLRYRGGMDETTRVHVNGKVDSTRVVDEKTGEVINYGDGSGYVSSSLRLNDRIIENAALTEIEQGLISLKKRIMRKERGKSGKH